MIIQELGLIGEVTLVRFVNDTMWVTFRDGQSALIASRKNAIRIRGLDFLINLKTEDWVAHVEREIALCSSNTVQLCTTPGNYLFLLSLTASFYDAGKNWEFFSFLRAYSVSRKFLEAQISNNFPTFP